MKTLSPDHLTRRTSLAALVASGAAGVLAHAPGGDAKQRVGKKAALKCKRQESQCVTSLTATCGGQVDCPTLIQQCCPFTAQCDVTGFFTCLERFIT